MLVKNRACCQAGKCDYCQGNKLYVKLGCYCLNSMNKLQKRVIISAFNNTLKVQRYIYFYSWYTSYS